MIKEVNFFTINLKTLILNNLEFDHADIFKDLNSIQLQFHHLVRIVPSTGRILLSDEPNLLEVIGKGCWSELSYMSKTKNKFPKWFIENQSEDRSSFKVNYKKNISASTEVSQVKMSLIGEHNQANALSAIAAAHHIGISIGTSSIALSRFKGVKRRLEKLDTIKGINIFDDFAHHPSAISSTLSGLKSANKKGRILAVIESRSNTMKMGYHNSSLIDSLRNADFVWWYHPEELAFQNERFV